MHARARYAERHKRVVAPRIRILSVTRRPQASRQPLYRTSNTIPEWHPCPWSGFAADRIAVRRRTRRSPPRTTGPGRQGTALRRMQGPAAADDALRPPRLSAGRPIAGRSSLRWRRSNRARGTACGAGARAREDSQAVQLIPPVGTVDQRPAAGQSRMVGCAVASPRARQPSIRPWQGCPERAHAMGRRTRRGRGRSPWHN